MVLRMVPVKEVRQLTLTFPMPDDTLNFETQIGQLEWRKSEAWRPLTGRACTGSLLSHLVGHEGPGSLLSLLKQEGQLLLFMTSAPW